MIKPLLAWWGRRRARERALALAALLAVAALGIDGLAFQPQRAQAVALEKQLTAARQQMRQLGALAAEHAAQGDAASRVQLEQLAARRRAAEANLAAADSALLPPHAMLSHLQTVLAAHPRLRVVELRSQPPQPLAGGDGAAALYQHGLELRVEGRYLDLLAWLDALERSPQRIYWRELDLRVGTDGVPITRVALFTLSREATWLQL